MKAFDMHRFMYILSVFVCLKNCISGAQIAMVIFVISNFNGKFNLIDCTRCVCCIFPCRLYELPESFSSSHIPPLAQKFLLRCLKPTPTSAGGWGVAVMRILRSMSNSIEFELMADIYENSVDLYFENEREQVHVHAVLNVEDTQACSA